MSENIVSLIKNYFKHYFICSICSKDGCNTDKVYSTDPFIRMCSVCNFLEETASLWKK